jgi:hypothetical protein
VTASKCAAGSDQVGRDDPRLWPEPGVHVYYVDDKGFIVSPYQPHHGPIVGVTASDTRGVSRRAHWGSLNGGGIGHVAGA